jgi:hypothetical protein
MKRYVMRPNYLLVTAIIFWFTPSLSQGFLHGNDLYRFCSMPDETREKATCEAFIIGAVDALTATRNVCLPKGFIGKQVTRLVIDYLHGHPETQHETAAKEINEALKRFNCNDSNFNSLSISR